MAPVPLLFVFTFGIETIQFGHSIYLFASRIYGFALSKSGSVELKFFKS